MTRNILTAGFLLAASVFGATAARAGQDWPFFLCTAKHGAHHTFVVGPSRSSATGFGLWTSDADGDWQMSTVTINKKVGTYSLSGCLSETRERFEVEIPLGCTVRCDASAAFGPDALEPLGVQCTQLVVSQRRAR